MTFVVAGVSGHTGKVVADTLLSEGRKVRVIARDQAKAAPFVAKGAEIAVADLTDAAALERAFTGAEGAYVLVPVAFGEADARKYQARVVAAMASAARATKIPHVVVLSSVGAQHPSGTGPIAGLGEAEKVFREIGDTKWTFIRAAYFMENLGASLGTLGQGFIPSFLPKDQVIPMIATVDIGKLAAKSLVEGARETSVIELAGPEVSMSQVAETLAKLTGKPVRVEEAPLSAVVPTFKSFGASDSVASLYEEMLGGMRSGKVSFEGGHRRVLGTTPIDEVLGGLLAG